MPATRLRAHVAALLGYLCIALVFTWPLPAHMSDAFPGDPSGDTGVYVWNLWVFRHEIVEHHRFPFLTREILALDPGDVPLTLHNYTTAANVVAFPLLEVFSVVTVFNLITIASVVLSAYAMFLFAWRRTGDATAAFAGGLLFGFSPFMMARASAHFSLIQAAPLPLFALILFEVASRPTMRLAVAAGVVVAWAFLSDPYYAVYCLLMLLTLVVHSLATIVRRPADARSLRLRMLLNLALLSVAGLMAGIAMRGGGRFELLGLRFSMTRLYTPMLVFTVLLSIRVWLTVRLRLAWRGPIRLTYLRTAAVAVFTCAVTLGPVLYAMATPRAGRPWRGPSVLWRSSAPGIDLAAWFTPNPLHPLWGNAEGWLSRLPNSFEENVASISWIAIGLIALAVVRGLRAPRGWWAFTAIFASLALGPFVHVAGINTYVPTPWTVLRYLPIIGAARMPTRMTILVMLGVSMLLAMALAHLRERSGRPRLLTAVVTALLLIELIPSPRPVYSAALPAVNQIIASDPTPIRVMNIPFGLKDGLSERGAYSARNQYAQTVHEKSLIGGYLSRLPDDAIPRYRRHPVIRVLLRLSEARALDPGMEEAALAAAAEFVHFSHLGYVVIDTGMCSPELISFVKRAFPLEFVAADGLVELYRTPAAAPLTASAY